jgi:thioredoxin 1
MRRKFPTLFVLCVLFAFALIVPSIPRQPELVAAKTTTNAMKTTKTANNNVAAKPKVVLVAITATWCVPCQAAKPTVATIERLKLAEVVRVDIDTQPEVAAQYQATVVPTFIVLKNGTEVIRSNNIEQVQDSLLKGV